MASRLKVSWHCRAWPIWQTPRTLRTTPSSTVLVCGVRCVSVMIDDDDEWCCCWDVLWSTARVSLLENNQTNKYESTHPPLTQRHRHTDRRRRSPTSCRRCSYTGIYCVKTLLFVTRSIRSSAGVGRTGKKRRFYNEIKWTKQHNDYKQQRQHQRKQRQQQRYDQ